MVGALFALYVLCMSQTAIAEGHVDQHHDEDGHRRSMVGNAERIASFAVGTGLLIMGLSSLARGRAIRGVTMTAAGGALASRGVSGRCAVYRSLGIEPEDAGWGSTPLSRHVHVVETITVGASPDEVYSRWRNLETLPDILSHLKHVEVLDEKRSRWIAEGPMGADVEWEATIEHDEPGRLISWRSKVSAPVHTEGRVEFKKAPGDRGTVVRVDLRYRPPGGAVGVAIAKLFRADPEHEIRDDLRRFKQMVEVGEVSTSRGPSAREDDEDSHHRRVPAHEATASQRRAIDSVEEASKESFPASDPPAW